jgi:lipopolysaccharide export system protein LptA/lipopolysaccharide export system protein LptC
VSWQKPARIGVALVGVASALAVYLTMGERRVAPPPKPVQYVDPKAIVSITGSLLKSFSGKFKDFEIDADRADGYEDGSTKLYGDPITINVRKGENRTFRVTAREARVSRDETYFELTGPVRLGDSDGFWLETAAATVNRVDSIAHIPGPATFGKGRMTGSGTGFSYDETRQVLLISKEARVKTVDETGKPVMQLSSGTAMLDRLQHVLTVDTGVHVVRNEQNIDTDHANSRLGVNNDIVTFIELHGNSRVTGGPPIDSMSARDLSLDYTEDGKTLEAVKMAGAASAAMAGTDGQPGTQIAGETVDLTLAADGELTGVVARDNVRLQLPASAETPPRTITAQALDGIGEAGKGLTQATFTRDVRFTEDPLRPKGSAAEKEGGKRTANSQTLEASLADDAVTTATFTGNVTFEETGLKACAAQAEYEPQKGSLVLTGATSEGAPVVAEEQVTIVGRTIDVGLDTRRMRARGDVTTWMRSPSMRRCKPATARAEKDQGANKVPRLLKTDAPVIIRAQDLEYDSRTGTAIYTDTGRSARLDQGDETAISGQRISIDQTKGDLTVTGNAISTLMLDNKLTTGRGHEIRYTDEKRLITYASAAKAGSAEVSLVSGPGSRLQAGSIDITLNAKDNALDTMRAIRNVRIVEGENTVTGGTRLDYTSSTGQYVVNGSSSTPVSIVQNGGDGCRQFSGNSITFNKENDKPLVIDGQQVRNAGTAPSKAVCTPVPAR